MTQPHVWTPIISILCCSKEVCKNAPPHLFPLLDTGVHVGEPVFDAMLTEGEREGGVKMDRGEWGER